MRRVLQSAGGVALLVVGWLLVGIGDGPWAVLLPLPLGFAGACLLAKAWDR